MEPKNVDTAADAKTIVEQRNLSHVKVGVFDVDRVLRGSVTIGHIHMLRLVMR